MHKIGICQIVGHPIFQGRPQFTKITTIDMYLFIEIRHNNLILHHGNPFEVEKLQSYA